MLHGHEMPEKTASVQAALETYEYLDEKSQRALANRLARIEGHIRAIQKMVLDRRCADEILLQTAAVKASINQFSAVLLDRELRACLDECKEGAGHRLDRATKVLSTLLKQS